MPYSTRALCAYLHACMYILVRCDASCRLRQASCCEAAMPIRASRWRARVCSKETAKVPHHANLPLIAIPIQYRCLSGDRVYMLYSCSNSKKKKIGQRSWVRFFPLSSRDLIMWGKEFLSAEPLETTHHPSFFSQDNHRRQRSNPHH